MDLHEGFNQTGFLSVGITRGITDLRSENADWFKLAEDSNITLVRVATDAMNAIHSTSMTPEAVAVRLLLRSCGTLQGVILLTERGMVTEGRTLVRSLTEDAFCIAALHDNPDAFMKMLKEDHEASRKNQGKFIISLDSITNEASRDKLIKAIDAIDKKMAIMSPKKVANLGPLSKQYLAYQRLSDDSAHPSATSLARHIHTDANRSGWNYKWGAGSHSENAATLHYALLAAFPIGVGITQMLKDEKNNAAFAPLIDRFQAMPSVPIV